VVVLNKPLVSLEVQSLFSATASSFVGGPSPSPSPALSTPTIIGIAAGAGGAVLILVVVLLVVFLYVRPRQKKKQASQDTRPEASHTRPMLARQRAKKIVPVTETGDVKV
jgi:flagellar biosynthesis/type III secretory pathway M-ring protein FliF/YscJ